MRYTIKAVLNKKHTLASAPVQAVWKGGREEDLIFFPLKHVTDAADGLVIGRTQIITHNDELGTIHHCEIRVGNGWVDYAAMVVKEAVDNLKEVEGFVCFSCPGLHIQEVPCESW